MKNKIKKMKLKDYFHLLILLFCYIPSLILKILKPNIWIVSENGNDAKDNGFSFFKYMIKNHQDVYCYYIISNDSTDYDKLKMYKKRLLKYNSLKHVIYTMACKSFISSQLASSFPYNNIFFNLYIWRVFNFNYVFLQHGITKEKVKCFYKKESGIDLFCCAANPEYDFVQKYFGYDDIEISKTGFCRYDELVNNSSDNNSILFMPTWRKELEIDSKSVSKKQEERFLKSDYYKNIQGLLNNKKLLKSLEKNNIIMYFCLHDNARIYKKYFKTKCKNIKIVDKTYEKTVNELIKKCSYLITDTSSVAFDFAYQNKSVLYFHFDYEDIIKKHWEKGYFDYDKHGFGKICYTVNETSNEIIKAIDMQFKNEKKYIDRVKDFFCHKDDQNCQRTFNAIKKLEEYRDIQKENKKSKKVKIVSYCNIILSFITLLFGNATNNLIVMLVGILLIMLNNIYYGLCQFSKRIYFSIFNFAIFTFLISKPLIKTFSGIEWWNDYDIMLQKMSLMSIYITLLCVFIGCFIYNQINFKEKIKKGLFKIKNFTINNNQIKIIIICFYITIFFRYIMEFEKLIFMFGKDYTEFYLTYQSYLPSIINFLGGTSTTFLMIYLTFLPKKKKCYLPLFLYLLSNVPNFLIGQRNPLVLSLLFIFCYAIVRDINSNEKFIGFKEKVVILLMIPIAIIMLDMHNYIRENSEMKGNMVDSFVDFFYTQGVSYDVLNMGYYNMETIRGMNKNYVFGPIIDYFSDNTIARKVFNMKGLGTGNNVNKALNGHSFTHILSFLSRSDYLEGHGYGSSYILELYCNYGVLGIMIFSIILGVFLACIPNIIYKSNILSVITLYITTSIFFLPRAETTSCIMFLFSLQFWIPILFLIFLLNKNTHKKVIAYEN